MSQPSSEEHEALQHGDRRAAEHFAEHHRPPRHRGHEHALQETFAAVFDDRDRGEDRREQQDHHQRAGKEMGVVELVRFARAAEARAEQQPEDDRLAQRAEHAVPLAEEPHQLALRQRADDRPGRDGRCALDSD